MIKPKYYCGKIPLKVSGGTLAKAFGAIKSAGLEDKFAAELEDHKITLDPETVNFLKDFIFQNNIHVGTDEHNRFASVVIKSPGGRCPDLPSFIELAENVKFNEMDS